MCRPRPGTGDRPAELVIDLAAVRFCGVRGFAMLAATARATRTQAIGYAVSGAGPISTGAPDKSGPIIARCATPPSPSRSPPSAANRLAAAPSSGLTGGDDGNAVLLPQRHGDVERGRAEAGHRRSRRPVRVPGQRPLGSRSRGIRSGRLSVRQMTCRLWVPTTLSQRLTRPSLPTDARSHRRPSHHGPSLWLADSCN
jgi:hypothetical protein